MKTPDDWQSEFDRLADGELSGDLRRELLDALDANPSQWRECALTLLEASDLRRSVRSIVASPPARSIGSTTVARRSSTLQSGAAWLALAASIAVAFVAGRNWSGSSDEGVANHNMVAQQSVGPPTQPGNDVHDDVDLERDDLLTVWTVDRNGARKSFDLPLVEADWIDQEVGKQLGPVVSDDMRAQFRQRGYDVESRRRFAPLVMENGQSYLLPVNDARLVPVSTPVY